MMTRLHTYTSTYTRIRTHMHAHTHTHARTHARTHTHTHLTSVSPLLKSMYATVANSCITSWGVCPLLHHYNITPPPPPNCGDDMVHTLISSLVVPSFEPLKNMTAPFVSTLVAGTSSSSAAAAAAASLLNSFSFFLSSFFLW